LLYLLRVDGGGVALDVCCVDEDDVFAVGGVGGAVWE